MTSDLFITGIGTEVGKTLISAVLVEASGFDYWKPVQAGDLDNTDTMKVKELVSREDVVFHPEGVCLQYPMSPHASAEKEGRELLMKSFERPRSEGPLIMEGAGGLMVPLNWKGDLVIDLIKEQQAEVILVSRNYLGSINHTLLSIEALRSRAIPVKGLIFSGDPKESAESIILERSEVPYLGRINEEPDWNMEKVKKYAKELSKLFV